ncbi:MAG: acetyl-CoA carboxylase biotin carboxyl carrier protein [Breznakia sp.]
MDTKKIKQMIRLFEESSLSEMNLEVDDIKIGMKKGHTQENLVYAAPVSNTQATVQTLMKEETNKVDEPEGEAITSPLVGVFYASNVEGGKPLVSMGSKVKKGDLLCVIEAMKVMNEIHADRDGEIVKVVCNDNETVQYGDVLMYIA